MQNTRIAESSLGELSALRVFCIKNLLFSALISVKPIIPVSFQRLEIEMVSEFIAVITRINGVVTNAIYLGVTVSPLMIIQLSLYVC